MTKSTSNTPTVWPDWLTGSDPRILESLEGMAAVQRRLKEAASEQASVKLLVAEQTACVVRAVEARGGIRKTALGNDKVDREVVKNVPIPRSFAAANVCEWQGSHETLRHFMLGSRLSLVRLLDGFSLCVQAENILVPLILLRSIIEHVALTFSIIKFLRGQPEPKDIESTKTTAHTIREQLNKMAYATRVNWTTIQKKHPLVPLKRKEAQYKHDDEWTVNREAKGIMKAVDNLEDEIQGIRAVYEILCEFAHPNVGTLMIPAEVHGPLRDKNGVLWKEHVLTLAPPTHFQRSTGEGWPRVLFACVQCLQTYERLQDEAKRQMARLLQMTQVLVKQRLTRKGIRLEPYEVCPCGSRKPFRFCCGGG